MKAEPFRIEPIFTPRIWGARSLAPLFPEKTNLREPIGEAWLTGINCKVTTGPFAGKTLGEAWREMPPEWRGTRFTEPGDFPILIKFIFPNDKLSIQVHPDDAYAAAHEKAAGGRGKTEMWYVVSAEPGAHVFVGAKQGVSKQQFRDAIAKNTVENLLEKHSVFNGDTFFVPAGTPHTIGPGMILCEVQEYSDLTYRVYDYGRVDAKGEARELHVEKAMQVMQFNKAQTFKTIPLALEPAGVDLALDDRGCSLLAACKYFAAADWDIPRAQKRYSGDSETSFSVFVFSCGAGQLVWREGSSTYKPGECWFLPAEFEECSVVPSRQTRILEAYVPDLGLLLRQLKSDGVAENILSQTVFP